MKTIVTKAAKNYLDNVMALIFILTPEGEIYFVNQYAAALTGYQPSEMTSKNYFEQLVPKETKEELKKKYKRWMMQKRTGSLPSDHYLKTKNDEWHLIHWQPTHLVDKKGNRIGAFFSGEDITEKHVLKRYLADQQVRYRQEKHNLMVEAMERERQYLASELHDGVNQVLITCKLLLECEVQNGNPSIYVQNAYTYLKEAIQTLRDLSHELNPVELGDEGLYEAALELIARINATGKIKITSQLQEVAYLKQLCPQISLTLFRIMQETLTNILKHAGAHKVSIRLLASSSAVDLEITDDGKGFDKTKKGIGLGLKTIYTRAEAVGGKAHMVSYPGEGTSLSVHIPFDFGARESQ